MIMRRLARYTTNVISNTLRSPRRVRDNEDLYISNVQKNNAKVDPRLPFGGSAKVTRLTGICTATDIALSL